MLLRKSLFQVFTRNYAKQLYRNPRTDVLTSIFIDKPEVIKWNDIRKKMLENSYQVNSTNIDSLIISKCFNGARLDIAKSYLEYLNNNNLSISDAFFIKLIRLYYTRYRMNDGDLSKKDFDDLLSYCNMITDKFQFLDPLTAENLIHGLSLTSSWRDAEKYFEMIVDKTPDKSTYSAFISRAIKEGDEKLVWKYLNEMISKQQTPKSFIYLEWFKRHENDKNKINEMFEYISENGLLMPEVDITEFSNVLRKNYNCSLVTINRKGKCPACSSQLPGVKLMSSEFNKIASAFLDDIIVKSDVFAKSNPKEIERFKNFVDKTMPYDCVIDGLNVAFSQGNKLSNAVYAKNLADVVKYFVDQKQKVLVIGRKYMDGWPRKDISFVKQNAKLFLVEDLSHDDLFLLYAAFKSGPKTNIFSRDLMRQHSHLLSTKLRNIFRRWQQEHQYTLITTKNRVIVRDPIQFEIKAHNVNFKWHVPFTKENVQASTQTFELPSMWICLKERLNSDVKDIFKE